MQLFKVRFICILNQSESHAWMTTGLLVDSSSHEIRRLLLFRQTQNFLIKGACCLPKQPYFPSSSTSSLKIFQTKLIVPPFEISNKCDHLDCDLVFIMHAVNVIPFYSASSLYVPFLSFWFTYPTFGSLIFFFYMNSSFQIDKIVKAFNLNISGKLIFG